MTTHEGSRDRETKITFDYAKLRRPTTWSGTALKNAVLSGARDRISGLQSRRGRRPLLPAHPESGARPEHPVPVSDGKKSVMAKVEAQQREDVKTPDGTFKTIRYEAYLFDNVLYRRSAHLNIWLTDDRRQLAGADPRAPAIRHRLHHVTTGKTRVSRRN